MSCEKHGYTNNVYCPACDLEQIRAMEKAMSRYPQVSRRKLKGKSANRRCSCCGDPAVWAITIQVNWFRGEDIEEAACEPHRLLAYSDPDEFESMVARHKAFMAEIVEAQHEETGRLWKGHRRDLPKRYALRQSFPWDKAK